MGVPRQDHQLSLGPFSDINVHGFALSSVVSLVTAQQSCDQYHSRSENFGSTAAESVSA
jgi:hypothetical protein